MAKNILIIAGEPSGDLHAQGLIKELKSSDLELSFWGIGGDLMREQGVDLVEHIRDLSIVGIWDVIKNIPKIRSHYANIMDTVKKRKPDLAVLVDYPGFNLRLAKMLTKRDIPVVYYIIPQVWAWGGHRIKALRKYTKKVIVLFKFEEELLRKHGVNCDFGGHPLVDHYDTPAQETAGERQKAQKIALLPGSRKSEVELLFPIMLAASKQIAEVLPSAEFVLAEHSNVDSSYYNACLRNFRSLRLTRIKNHTSKALEQSIFAIVASGTATLETAIAGVPMVLTYKVHPLTYPLMRFFMRVPLIGLVNIVAKKEIIPELLQKNAEPDKIADEVIRTLKDHAKLDEIKSDLLEVKHALGEKGASKKAAGVILNFISKNHI